MSSMISIDGDTTPIKALRTAYACGRSRHTARAKLWDFTEELSEHVTRRYGTTAQARFLPAGFTAGYFNRPMPDIERINAPGEPADA